MIEQITIRELLKDEVFRHYMARVPQIIYDPPDGKEPWWLYVRQDGRWRRARIRTYVKAYGWLKSHLKTLDDAAITSRRQAFAKPRWLTPPLGHDWCPYCRRPVVFAYFDRHHAFPDTSSIAEAKRCTICGIRLQAALGQGYPGAAFTNRGE
jgi:hypothetical protein